MAYALTLANHAVLRVSLVKLWAMGLPASWNVFQARRARERGVLPGQKTVRGSSAWAEAPWLVLVTTLFNWRALANLRGVLEPIVGRRSGFVRTPKTAYADQSQAHAGPEASIDTAALVSNHPVDARNGQPARARHG